MGCWLTIEVQDAEVPASIWRSGRGQGLTEAALTTGAKDWAWHALNWGVILEIEFVEEMARETFRALPGVRAALDAVPEAVRGLYVYPDRGGGAAFRVRRPRSPAPIAGAGAVEQAHEEFLDLETTPAPATR